MLPIALSRVSTHSHAYARICTLFLLPDLVVVADHEVDGCRSTTVSTATTAPPRHCEELHPHPTAAVTVSPCGFTLYGRICAYMMHIRGCMPCTPHKCPYMPHTCTFKHHMRPYMPVYSSYMPVFGHDSLPMQLEQHLTFRPDTTFCSLAVSGSMCSAPTV